MKNKNGFTLVELLSVVIILALIALIATPIIIERLKTSKEDLFNEQIKLIEAGALSYVTDVIVHPELNPQIYGWVKNHEQKSTNVSLGTLQNSGAVEFNIANPLCNGQRAYLSPIDTQIKISYDGKEFDFEVLDIENVKLSCTEKVQNNEE